jgi:hypothetical protein
MTSAFSGSDAEGAWDWKTAYDACEGATVLFLRRFGRSMKSRAGTPAALLGMLEKLAALLPSQTRRSEASQIYQQFSTPIAYGFVAATAAAMSAADLALEPSAGTGLLAIYAELAGAGLALNELADARADLLARLFSRVPLTRYNAAHIDDHLDPAVQPTVVLINLPFSAAVHVDGRVADAAFRHVASALSRLAEGGRLVAITGANLSPDNPVWRDSFIRLQERGRIVFSAAAGGSVYAPHGTTIDTRLTVIDRVPAEDPASFPASPGTAPNPVTLLNWVAQCTPARPIAVPASARPLHVLRFVPRVPTVRSFSAPIRRPATIAHNGIELSYEPIEWWPPQGTRISDTLYEPYALSTAPSGECHIRRAALGCAARKRYLRRRGSRLLSGRIVDGRCDLRCRLGRT